MQSTLQATRLAPFGPDGLPVPAAALNPALLAIDWGSTALRGALLAADGTLLAGHSAPLGLLSIPAGGWAAVFEHEFGAWRASHPGLLCLLAGMVGSRQGWVEAPYCACPAGLADLAAKLCWLPADPTSSGGRLAIVPGLSITSDGLPDVMRGEETQVFGALRLLAAMAAPPAGLTPQDATLVLPGTHSKWVAVQGGRITGFATHMTGECYALLRHQSMLARSLPADDSAWRPDAFDRGVARAQAPGGLLHHVFAVRTLALFDREDGPALACYLSGLLIGDELRAQALAAGQPVLVVGSAALTLRYQRALAQRGHPVCSVGAEAGWAGLLALQGTLRA